MTKKPIKSAKKPVRRPQKAIKKAVKPSGKGAVSWDKVEKKELANIKKLDKQLKLELVKEYLDRQYDEDYRTEMDGNKYAFYTEDDEGYYHYIDYTEKEIDDLIYDNFLGSELWEVKIP
jgi:hypothetical protein